MEKYNLDLNGSDHKSRPQINNYSRDDSGLGPNGKNIGVTQENDRQDINGSMNKPYPQERNFTTDIGPTQPTGMGIFVPSKDFGDDVSLGQAKYAKRAGATSIYKDVTRNTADDNKASAKAESSVSPGVGIDQTEGTDLEQDK